MSCMKTPSSPLLLTVIELQSNLSRYTGPAGSDVRRCYGARDRTGGRPALKSVSAIEALSLQLSYPTPIATSLLLSSPRITSLVSAPFQIDAYRISGRLDSKALQSDCNHM